MILCLPLKKEYLLQIKKNIKLIKILNNNKIKILFVYKVQKKLQKLDKIRFKVKIY